METKLTPEQKKKNASWTHLLVGFWIVLVAGTAWFLYLAIDNQSELVAPDYYEKGVAYQTTIDQRQKFNQWFPTTQPKWSNQQFQFATRVSNISDMRAKLYRASDKTKDQMVQFHYSPEDSLWLTPTTKLLSGPWEMTLRIVVENDTTQQTFKQFVP